MRSLAAARALARLATTNSSALATTTSTSSSSAATTPAAAAAAATLATTRASSTLSSSSSVLLQQYLARLRVADAQHASLATAAAAALPHALLPPRRRAIATSAAPCAAAEPAPSEGDAAEPEANPKVKALADEICGLTVLECSWLSEILRKRLGVAKPAFGAMQMMAAAAPAPGAAPAAAGAAAAAEPEKKEKTEFSVKLESFSPDGKIKVIKEVRAATGLGLKEAKELVEKAPCAVKVALPKAEAEALKKLLEAAGAKAALE